MDPETRGALEDVKQQLREVTAALERLRAELGLEAWFDCYWCASALPAGPSLSAETLGRVAALDAHLALDLATTPDASGTGPGAPAP